MPVFRSIRAQVVLDLEVLGKKEEQNFVWRGYDALLEAA